MFALLQAAMLVHIKWTNIFANNSEAENLTDLKLVYLSVSFNSLPSWRQALNSFDFLFQWRDNESSPMTSTIQNGWKFKRQYCSHMFSVVIHFSVLFRTNLHER